ncbi:MAG: hypothetical protein H0W03_05375 [Solirubrobacterales bacterium]|nr:hypothetical protein [Solirubrobacterales bacterium]
MSDALFGFCQFEFPWLLGPAPGRYVLREQMGEAPGHVLVVAELGAPQRRRLRGRRPRRAGPEPDPEPVATGRATVVDAQPLGHDGDAARWLAGSDLGELADAAIVRLGGAVHAHRLATADPAVPMVTRRSALVTRVGFGPGEEVADGHWTEARTVPPTHPGRRGRRAMAAQERLAALLGGRDAALACEELTLRARSDVDAGREREAALQVRVALEAALAELPAYAGSGTLEERLRHLGGSHEGVAAAAQAALSGGLTPEQLEHVILTLRRLEAALRAVAAGL